MINICAARLRLRAPALGRLRLVDRVARAADHLGHGAEAVLAVVGLDAIDEAEPDGAGPAADDAEDDARGEGLELCCVIYIYIYIYIYTYIQV